MIVVVRRQVDYSPFIYAPTTLKDRCVCVYIYIANKDRCIYDFKYGGEIPLKRYILD
jgi:hypothetical protein